MDILRCHVFEVNIIDGGTGFHVQRHPGGSYDVVDGQLRVGIQLPGIIAGSGKSPVGGNKLPGGIGLFYLGNGLKKPGTAGDAILFQRRGDRQTDGLLRPALIRYHQIGGHGVQFPLDALHGGIEGF